MRVVKNKIIQIFWGDRDFIFKACKSLETLEITLPKQVHGTTGFRVSKGVHALFEREGDFSFTTEPNIGIGVITADCLPVVLYIDTPCRGVAVIHAGWRGLLGGVIEAAYSELIGVLGAPPENIYCAIGPSIGSCCYTVHDDFIDTFMSSQCSRFKATVISPKESGQYRVNLQLLVHCVVKQCGIIPENIDMSSWECTACKGNYWSWRRDRNEAGRNVTIARLFTSDE